MLGQRHNIGDASANSAAQLLSREECEEILANILDQRTGVHLECFHLDKASDAIGFLGEYYQLTLHYAMAGTAGGGTDNVKSIQPIRLFVKAICRDNTEPQKEQIFEKEAFLYRKLLGELQKLSTTTVWCARSYYTRADLIVLEDLKLLGYEAGHAIGGDGKINRLQMQQILTGLAAFHASSIVYEVRNRVSIGNEFRDMLQEITVADHIAWYRTGLKAITTVAGHLYRCDGKVLEEHLKTVVEMVNPSQKYRNILCHRDIWLGNIFFPKNPTQSVVFVDFQTCRYSPPIIDFIFTIFMNLSREERKRSEMKYLKSYYNDLKRNLNDFDIHAEDHVTERELMESYDEFQLFGLVYSVIATTILKVPKEFVTNTYKHIDRCEKVLELMRTNDEFRCEMEESIKEILDYLHPAANCLH